MNTAKDIADTLISRAKEMQKFTVERYMDAPPFFKGSIPFDIQHSEGGPWRFFVYAVSEKEAGYKVDKWLDTQEDFE
jgi:hypothetical protein